MSNYKLKSSSSISKRFKITASSKLLRHKACRNHLLQKKSSKRKRQLRKVTRVKYVDLLSVKLNIF